MELKTYFVAYIDILGFKSIVEKEKNSGFEGNLLNKLHACHLECERIFRLSGMDLTQFSDSIVISLPYKPEDFVHFATTVSVYQKHLIKEGILCRGGIAINKHFSQASFLFSPALIDAFYVESERAIYPRIVISNDVIDLLYPHGTYPDIICKEYDGLFFINFLNGETSDSFSQTLSELVNNCLGKADPSIIQKGIWLANYSDWALSTSFSPQRFEISN
ncbi:hypothetical protein EH164_16155 [Kosakonia sp. CCTCC M2018092]|uniref:hypothetical protein n=1 Tax=Kosakonia sp. CCTCC M2018092 TaxID=2492396 RepID=UPI000F60BF38|nr:hypothetical protein [Kosakonia sp. CCTCC M2018092]AZI88491.1 hypothetical protein EH164_16155 [Kosakonia sp. CCTCC M2018092]